jgi:molecular chaperone DnaK
MSQALALGIDLGTTNSAAAVFDGSTVQLVRNSQGGVLTPSVVRLDARGNVVVGAKARKLLEADPENTRSEFKRLMGVSRGLEFPAAGKQLKPEALSAEILKSLRSDVQEQFGFAPERAVISVPALFELPQASATSEAARLAGFERVELMQEPIASALAAGWTNAGTSGSWLVYDLGGGTFDVSLLETREGLLRVIGHDGDNFLGGRDFDWVLVDFVLAQLERASGASLKRADPALQQGVRKLKLAIEDAKIELTRAAETSVCLSGLTLGAHTLDVDVTLARDEVECLCLPLVDRSIAVCLRLLQMHGQDPSQLSRLVLVGGPTVMPVLRARVKALLGVPFSEGLDPMTLVAQGAALFAATSGLDARPARREPVAGRRIWLQYPAVTSDLSPHVVGRLVEASGARPTSILLKRSDGWSTAASSFNDEGAFVLAVDLLPRRSNEFVLHASAADGQAVEVNPASIFIVHGVTLADPPLSRTIGVALARDLVQIYFERGAPLPAKRTFRHETIDTVLKGQAESLLKIPIVQGEYDQAHLCRLVGALEIRGTALLANLPAGTPIELTLELDRGGRLSARALVTTTQQVFEEVAQLMVPDASVDALRSGLGACRLHLQTIRTAAFRHALSRTITRLAALDEALAGIESDIGAAAAGDADAAQKAHRSLLELDATLEGLEVETKFPELEEEAHSAATWASSWVSRFATPQEQRLFDETVSGLEKARAAKQVLELQRRVRQVRQLGLAAYYKHPDSWEWEFDHAASEVNQASDLPRAEKLVQEGRAALARRDTIAVKQVTQQLWKLMPVDAQTRKLSHESGLR